MVLAPTGARSRGPLLSSFSATGVAFLASLILYTATLLLVHFDTAFAYRWLAFALWLFAVLAVPSGLLIEQRRALAISVWPHLRRARALVPVSVLILLALACSFIWLSQYPYVAIYDQVRDGGLNAAEIARGQLKNLFGYGRYGSHGLTIPTIAAAFYRLFGASVLTYRVPAALLAATDVLLLYAAGRRVAGRPAAWFAALILLTLPLHLYYGRTELVVISSSVLMTGLLLMLSYVVERTSRVRYLLLGLYLGFSSNFHGSILTVALFTLVGVIAVAVYRAIRTRRRAPLLACVILLVVGYLVGFGPKLLFTTPATFLHSGEAFYARDGAPPASGSVVGNTLAHLVAQPGTLAKHYGTSLLVYLHEPTRSTHYPVWQPLLDPLVAGLFLVGAAAALLSRNALLWLLVVYALLIPFTNSAMTNVLNADNRLLPALPVAAALAGYGAAVVLWTLQRGGVVVRDAAMSHLRTVRLERGVALLGGLLAVYLLVRGILFFTDEPASRGYGADDYLSMRAIYLVRSLPSYQRAKQLCFAVSPQRFQYFANPDNRLLISEQYQYFLPDRVVHIYSSPDVRANELYLSAACNANTGHHFTTYRHCRSKQSFTCPQGGALTVYAEDDSVPARPAEGLAFLGVAWTLDSVPTYIP